MSLNKERLKQLRELLRREIREVMTTANTPGYQTPYAFTGGKPERERKRKKRGELKSVGYKLAPRKKRDIYENSYYQYRNDDSKTPRQKVGTAIREIRTKVDEIEKIIRTNLRLKKETELKSGSYWKRSHGQLNRINEKMIRIMNQLKQLGG